MIFSEKFDFKFNSNEFIKLYDNNIISKKNIINLVNSNPSDCGFVFEKRLLEKALCSYNNSSYIPDPKGFQRARSIISDYYGKRGKKVNSDYLILTSSSSEAYSYILKLITNPGDNILIPAPSYPLIEQLAIFENVKVSYYDLVYSDIWEIKIDSLTASINDNTKAVVLINPGNPAGNYVKKNEMNKICDICRKRNISLIVDEVFFDYYFEKPDEIINDSGVLIFFINGISKMLALPQMKLSWIYVDENSDKSNEALERLEFMADTYLSVSAPVQNGLEIFFNQRENIQKSIKDRINTNYSIVKSALSDNHRVKLLNIEGGWYSVLKLNMDTDEEEFCIKLLKEKNTFVHPGYFYDFQNGNYLIVSLICGDRFSTGIKNLCDLINNYK